MKKIFIYSNDVDYSKKIKEELIIELTNAGFEISEKLSKDIAMIICIGGDGTLLSLMRDHQFPTIPIAGINTGHLGFFQEISPERINHFIEQLINQNYLVQPYNIAKVEVITADGVYTHRALNEFVVRSASIHSVHLNISVNDSFIEKFSGDGICVATPAGSTAYNYSLGGSLVDPRLNLLQVTPIAPMKTNAYRSLTSSILLPPKDELRVTPHYGEKLSLMVMYDGVFVEYDNIEMLKFNLSRRKINLVRLNDSTFWDKVKHKFI